MMIKVSAKVQKFMRDNRQVFSREGWCRWMPLKMLRKAVIAGEADDWDVLETRSDTGEIVSVCPYCATGVEHPDNGDSLDMPPASRTLH
jgi:hypothetical protein